MTPVEVDGPRLVVSLLLYLLGAWAVFRAITYRRRWREMLLALGAVATAFVLAEAALRALRPYESLPRFRWIASPKHHHLNPPGRRMLLGYVEGRPIVVDTNEDGFRTHHTRGTFAASGVRVLVLGDSFVFGSGVDGADAFAGRLEGLLKERLRRDDVAVLNAGIISYSPFLERLLMDGLMDAYRPTAVVLLLDVTDIGDDFVYARKARPRDGRWEFEVEGDRELRYFGAVHELLRPGLGWLGGQLVYPAELARGRRIGPRKPNYYLDPVVFEGEPENRFFVYRYPLERTEAYFEQTLVHVRAVAERAARGGARFTLAVAPRYHHWDPRECPYDWQRRDYAVDEPYQYEYFRFFEQRRAVARFPILDLLPAFRASAERPLVFEHDPHWNARGHALVAGAVRDHLVGAGLVPAP